MIYNLTRVVLVPGKMPEYYAISSKELVPLQIKLGMKIAGSFHSYTGNMNESFTLFAYDDLAAYQKLREATTKDKDYQRVYAKLQPLNVSQTRIILEANPWSPMK